MRQVVTGPELQLQNDEVLLRTYVHVLQKARVKGRLRPKTIAIRFPVKTIDRLTENR